MAAQSEIRVRVRNQIDDEAGDNLVRVDDLSSQIDGAVKRFRTSNVNLVASSLIVEKNGVVETLSSIDLAKGIFELVTAPVVGNKLTADYNWQRFSDGEIDDFSKTGQERLVVSSISTMDDGLIPALTHYASAEAFKALAARTAHYFSAGAGGKSVDKTFTPSHYLKLMETQIKLAEEAKEQFYKRAGRREQPFSTSVSHVSTIGGAYTPRR